MSLSQPLGFCLYEIGVSCVALGLGFYYAWQLTLLILATLPILGIVMFFVSKRLAPAIEAQKQELSLAAKYTNTAISNINTVKAYNGEDHEIWQYCNMVKKVAASYLLQARANALQFGIMKFATVGLFVQGFWFGLLLVNRGMDPGRIYTTYYVCLIAMQSIEIVLPQWLVLAKGKSAGHTLKAIVEGLQQGLRRKVPGMGGGLVPEVCDGDIEIKNVGHILFSGLESLANIKKVSFSYPSNSERVAMSGVNFFFPANEITYIVGRSGSGKSTVGNLLMQYYEIDQGEILIDGNSIRTLNLDWLRENITLVQQQSILFNETILQNICFGKKSPATNEEIFEATQTADLQNTLDALPQGLNTIVGSSGKSLSGGQQQRIALARARLRNSPIVILDEATSALDQKSRSLVMEKIREWRKNKTTIIITHDVSTILADEYVYVLEQGAIVQEGYRKALEEQRHGIFATLLPAAGIDLPNSTHRRSSPILPVNQAPESSLPDFEDLYAERGTFAKFLSQESDSRTWRKSFGVQDGPTSLGMGSVRNNAVQALEYLATPRISGDISFSPFQSSIRPKSMTIGPQGALDPYLQSLETTIAFLSPDHDRRSSFQPIIVQHRPPTVPYSSPVVNSGSSSAKPHRVAALVSSPCSIDVSAPTPSSSHKRDVYSYSSALMLSHERTVTPDRSEIEGHASLKFLQLSCGDTSFLATSTLSRSAPRTTTIAKDPPEAHPVSESNRHLLDLSATAKSDIIMEESPKMNQNRPGDFVLESLPGIKPQNYSYDWKSASMSQILRTIWPMLNKMDRAIFLFGFFASFIVAIATPAFAFVLAQLLNVYYLPTNRSAIAMKWALILIGIAIVDSLATFCSHLSLEYAAQQWVNALRVEALKRILAQPKSWFDKERNSPHRLSECLDRNAEEMRNLIGRFVGPIFITIWMMSITVVWALVISYKLTLVAMACFPLIYLNTRLNDFVSSKWENKCNQVAASASTIFNETFSNIRVVRALTLENHFKKKHENAVQSAWKTGLRRGVYSGMMFGVIDSLTYFVMATIFYYGATIITSRQITILEVLKVLNLLLFGIANATSLLILMPQINSSRSTGTQMLYLAQLPRCSSHETTGTKRIPSPFPVVFRDLNFTYPSRYEGKTLNGINLTLPAGSCTAIVGPSGSGKSTIASLLLGLYPPNPTHSLHAFPLTFAGVPSNELNISSLRNFISIVAQQPLLFPTTVYANIVYGLPEGSPYSNLKSAIRAANDAGIHEFIDSLAHGYNTIIGDGGMGISGGQAQRIVIARALIRRPKILILDEATSALDKVSAIAIRDCIGRIMQRGKDNGEDTAVVLISHDVEMMRIAGRIVVVQDGKVVEEGGFNDLLKGKDGKKFRELIGMEGSRRDIDEDINEGTDEISELKTLRFGSDLSRSDLKIGLGLDLTTPIMPGRSKGTRN